MDPDCLQTIEQQLPEHRATVPPGADPKWRFFWRLGPRPERTQFAELNAEPVIPAGKLSVSTSCQRASGMRTVWVYASSLQHYMCRLRVCMLCSLQPAHLAASAAT